MPRRASRKSARPTKCSRVLKSAPPTINWAGTLVPAKISGRPRIGARALNSAAQAGAGDAATTAIFSSRCSARRRAPAAAAAAAHSTPAAARTITPRCCSICEASLNGGTRSFTLRVPEIDAEGRLVSKERVLNVQVPKGILPVSRYDWLARGERTAGEGKPGDLLHRSRVSASPPVPSRWPRFVSGIAGGAVGSGARRHREDAHSRRHGGFENSRRLARRQQIAPKGRGIPASPPGDFYVVLQIALPPANDEKAKAAYAALAAALPFNPRASLGV